MSSGLVSVVSSYGVPSRATPRGHDIEALRAVVRGLEKRLPEWKGVAGEARPLVVPLGVPGLDRRLPGGGLPLACLHLLEGPRGEWDEGAVTGFTLALLTRLLAARPGRVLWVSPWRDLYAPGLASQGLDPERFLLLRTPGEAETLWALEEGLRCGDLVAVVGELENLPRQAARRLQLAAEAGGVTAFLLSRGLRARRHERQTVGAATRWSVSAFCAQPPSPDFLSEPRWDVELLRCRGAAPGRWRLTWRADGFLQEAEEERKEDHHHAASLVPLAAALCRGTLAQAGAKPGRPHLSAA